MRRPRRYPHSHNMCMHSTLISIVYGALRAACPNSELLGRPVSAHDYANACLLQYGFTRTRYWLYDFSGTCTEQTADCSERVRVPRSSRGKRYVLRARAQLSVRVRSCVGGEHWRTSKRNTETCRRILVANSPRNRWHSAKHTGRHSARPLSCPWTPWAGRSAPSSRTGSC